MKPTKKALANGETVIEGNISIKLINGAYMVQDYTGSWCGYATYAEAKEAYYTAIMIAENLNLQ